MITRRHFIQRAAAFTSAALALRQPRRYKLGLQLFTVRAAMRQDAVGTLKRALRVDAQVVPLQLRGLRHGAE